jgi:DNA-binding NarL/FixJ family response regulator
LTITAVPPRSKPASASARVGAWAKQADCIGRPEAFDDLRRTGEALRKCATCPVLRDCREWALRNAVYGVAGGMTPSARAQWRRAHRVPEPVITLADFLPLDIAVADQGRGLGRSDVIMRAITQRAAEGQTAREIADELGVTTRTIERLMATSTSGASHEGSSS